MRKRAKVLGMALGVLLAFGGATATRAADRHSDCDRKIDHEQHELDRAVDHHGRWSRQAEHERRELDRLYEKCGYRDRDRDRYRDRDYDRDRYR